MPKTLHAIHPARPAHWVGDGFFVRSAFTYDDLAAELSPFLLLDHGAPREFAPTERRLGVGPHPHRGFETVTIAFQGEIEHRDSSGGGGVIGPGDVQWMTAGNGIVHEEFHSERFARTGGTLEMVQLWVNLPRRSKRAPARYQALAAQAIPRIALPGGAGELRVISGNFDGQRGPAESFTPIDLWSLTLNDGGAVSLAFTEGHSSALLVLEGTLELDGERSAREGELVVFSRAGSECRVRARGAARVLALSGEPIDEPLVGYGPFVMNTMAEIREAIADFQSGRMGTLAPR